MLGVVSRGYTEGEVHNPSRLVERYEYTPYGQRTVFSKGYLAADFNDDGVVDGDDETIYTNNLGQPGNIDKGDFTGDGTVSVTDGNYFALCPEASVRYDNDPLTMYPRLESFVEPTVAGIGSGNLPLCDVGHQGLHWDREFQMWDNRTRPLNSTLGRYPVRDFASYADGMNLYQYVRSNPVIHVDPMGLWGANIHRDKTTEWSKSNGVGMVQWAAEKVGYACNDVDPTEWKWPFHTTKANLEWHFDIPVTKPNSWGSGDSRWDHSVSEFSKARFLCLESRHPTDDDVIAALDALGRSLHPLEDWVAHGVWNPTYHWYNVTNWRAHPDGTDDFGKDDNRASDGRLQDDLTSADNQKKYLVPGTKRATLTEKMAKERLLAFKNGLQKGGKCWCKIFVWK